MDKINTNLDTTPLPPNDLVAQDQQSAELAGYVRTKTFGREVREAIARSIELNSTRSKSAEILAKETLSVTETATTNMANQVELIRAEKDAVIANATVDSEVILARGGKDTLGKRLDGIAYQNPIFVADYGVSHLNTAEVNTPLFKQAFADAESQKKPIILPWCPPDTFIEINDEIVTSSDYMNISGFGRNTRIKQLDNTKGIFYANGKYSSLKSFSVFGTPFERAGSGATHILHFGIRIESSYSKVDDIYGDVLSTVVRVSTRADGEQNVGSSVTNVESGHNVVFNLLVSHTKDFRFDNITGSYSDLAETPPHLIYVDNSSGYNHYNMQGGYSKAWDGTGSYAFQFKGMRGGNAGVLHSENCHGNYHVMDSYDFHCDEVIAIDDTWDSEFGMGSFSLESVNESRNLTVDKVTIEMAGKGKPMFLDHDLYGCVIKNINIISNHTSTVDGQFSADIDIFGNNVTLIDPIVKNKGDFEVKACIGVRGGSGLTIDNPTTSGNERGIYVGENIENVKIINYKEEQQENVSRAVYLLSPVVWIEEGGINKVGNVLEFDKLISSNEYTQHFYTSSGREWTLLAGTLKRVTGKNQFITTGSLLDGTSAWLDVGTPNIKLSANITYGDSEGLIGRVIDRKNFLGVRISHLDNTASIYSYDDGVMKGLKSTPFTHQIGRRYQHKMVIFNNQIDYFIDGVLLLSHKLSSENMTKYGTQTNHGILGRGSENGKFDTIIWESVE